MDRKEERERKLQWVKLAIETTNKSASELADNAGLSNTTLTRFLNPAVGTKEPSIPKDKTLDKIAVANNILPYTTTRIETLDEAASFRAAGQDAFDREKNELKQVFDIALKLTPYVHKGRALELEGIKDGDILFVDHNARPMIGDIIYVQILNENELKQQNIFRLFHTKGSLSLAITATTADIPIDQRYQVLDGINAIARGVVKFQIRSLK